MRIFIIFIIASFSIVLFAEYIDPYALVIGNRYRLGKDTPLMPEYEPLEPLSAIPHIKTLSKGGVFKVIDIRKKRHTPWYYVECEGKKGWINCIALVGQNFELVESTDIKAQAPVTSTSETQNQTESLSDEIGQLRTEIQSLKIRLERKNKDYKNLKTETSAAIQRLENEASNKWSSIMWVVICLMVVLCASFCLYYSQKYSKLSYRELKKLNERLDAKRLRPVQRKT